MNEIVMSTGMPAPSAPSAARHAKSEAAAVEHSRAVAEVHAAAVLAQSRPRDLARCIQRMREVCNVREMAERAFWSLPRSGQKLEGRSIHFARALAACWGNVSYGVKELARDDGAKVSEMLAYAWDLETNTRVEAAFIVPHYRDTKNGRKALIDMRDIYENNANNGARRLRECILSVMPVWFVDEAEEACRKTLAGGGQKALAQRLAQIIELFESVGVSKKRLERHVGRATAEWTAVDGAALANTYRAIRAGETTVDDEFEDEPRAVSDAGGQEQPRQRRQKAQDAPSDPPAPEAPPPEDAAPEPSSEPSGPVSVTVQAIDGDIWTYHLPDQIDALAESVGQQIESCVDNASAEDLGAFWSINSGTLATVKARHPQTYQAIFRQKDKAKAEIGRQRGAA